MPNAYASVAEAQTYFDTRLHETAWSLSSATDQQNSLYAATAIIDRLAYKGVKKAVNDAFLADTDLESNFDSGDAAALATVAAAEASQAMEFPRGTDTNIPNAILVACYAIAYSRLDGVDPDLEMENLAIQRHSIGGTTTVYDRSQEAPQHIVNGVPSATAWRNLRPYLRDGDHIRIMRVS